MRDDSLSWSAPAALTRAPSGFSVTERVLIVAHVSGPRVLDARPAKGWPDIISGDDYTVALRPDRVMVIGEALLPGWHADAREAVTDMSDACRVLDIAGPGALAALRKGAELSLSTPSRSVMRRVFGMDVALYRHGDADTFRCHIPRGHAQAFFELLTG